jgi:hypothetical protein
MTTTVNKLFTITNAHSKGYAVHSNGAVAFVTNGVDNNGILGFVEPLKDERVFDTAGICVSSFCEATVQKPPYLPRGNGGSGLIVLTPIEPMTYEQLYSYASQINLNKWKFSFGRMVTADRLRDFSLVEKNTERNISVDIDKLRKKHFTLKPTKLSGQMKNYIIDDIFDIEYGQKEYESKDGLEAGEVMLISSKGEDQGCYGFFNIEPYYSAPIITVPRTGTIGHAFVQEKDCCANSDCIVLTPKKEYGLTIEQLRQIAYQIRSVKWKYNYGRKITPERIMKEPIVLY